MLDNHNKNCLFAIHSAKNPKAVPLEFPCMLTIVVDLVLGSADIEVNSGPNPKQDIRTTQLRLIKGKHYCRNCQEALCSNQGAKYHCFSEFSPGQFRLR